MHPDRSALHSKDRCEWLLRLHPLAVPVPALVRYAVLRTVYRSTNVLTAACIATHVSVCVCVGAGPVILAYLARTATANDDFVAAPSGVGYTYPSIWEEKQLNQFAELTSDYMARTSSASQKAMRVVNTIGDPCVGGTFFPGCSGLNEPNMSSIAPVLAQSGVDGMFWYTFGAGAALCSTHHHQPYWQMFDLSSSSVG